jgi:hypothetical protein
MRRPRPAFLLLLLPLAFVWLAGCEEPEAGPAGPDIRGVVTALARGDDPGALVGTLRVEGARMEDTRFAKAIVRVDRDTKIFQRVPAGRSPAPFATLRLGDKVEVRFTGPVAVSFPVQGTAGEILILVHLAPPTPPPAPPEDPYPPDFAGTEQGMMKAPPDRLPLPLRDVRTGPQESFDRAVFEFDGDTIPGFRVEYVAKPVHCGSGQPAELGGRVWLQVKMNPAEAHNAQGGATVGALQRRPNLKTIRTLQETCDLDGDVTWVLGLAERTTYRVFELRNPPRIVVDVNR